MDNLSHTTSSFALSPLGSLGSYYQEVHRTVLGGDKEVHPARDVRYPAYAGQMSDGRLVTDYRPQCSKNIAAGKQFHTKHWMIQHAVEMMDESRRRHVEGTGASLPMAHTVPPPASVVYSTPFESEIHPSGFQRGIGVERANAAAPELFGTFSHEASIREIQHNRKNTSMTIHEEGGRNSRRG